MMPSTNDVFAGLGTTIFETMSRLARDHDAVNLGQGFPETDGPQEIRHVASCALMDQAEPVPADDGTAGAAPSCCCPRPAVPRARGRLADRDAGDHRGHGGIELQRCWAFLNPGDEVIVFQPCYDAYVPIIRRAGGVPIFVNLQPPDWRFDPDDLAKAVGSAHPHGAAQLAAQSDRIESFDDDGLAAVAADCRGPRPDCGM